VQTTHPGKNSVDEARASSKLVRGSAIAAMYTVLTLAFEPISFGPVQIRVAESLTVLPILVDEAVAGLFVGCLLANLLGGLGFVDVFFGSMTTLAAAWGTRFWRESWLAYACPIVLNALVVGGYLSWIYHNPFWFTAPSILIGELIAVVGLGVPLVHALRGQIPGGR